MPDTVSPHPGVLIRSAPVVDAVGVRLRPRSTVGTTTVVGVGDPGPVGRA